MAIVLTIVTTDGVTTEFEIKTKITIGRSTGCDLQIEDSQMSGKHGYFEVAETGELIYGDLNSTNGSYLNNSQIQKSQMRVNDVLRVGTTMIRIVTKKLSAVERFQIGKRASKTKADYRVPELLKTQTDIKPKKG